MRCLASVLALLCCTVAVAGCGAREAAGPLDEALGHLPADAPLAVAIDTDVDGDQYRSLDRIVEKFPFGEQVKRGLQEQIEDDEGVDFERDIEPVLGNPFVVGAPDAGSVTGGAKKDEFVGAIQATDKGKLEDLVARSKPEEVGEQGGATIYRERDGDTFAVRDDVLIVAGSRALLESALDRREQDDRLRAEDFDRALEGLPGQALLRAYVDLEALIDSDPGSRAAQRVRWVDGLRTLGMTGTVEDEGLKVDFRLRTEDVSEKDLPIAPGEDSPGVVERPGEVAVGIRDLSRIVEFGEAAGQAVDPSGFGDYEAGKQQIDGLLGVSIDDDVIAQLKGDTALGIGLDGRVAVRAELEDPAAFERTLGKLDDSLARVAEGLRGGEFGLATPGRGEDLYRLTDSDGKNTYFGVVDEVFVLDDSAAGARRLASASPEQVPGARGSVVVSADAEKLAEAAISRLGSHLGLGGVLGGRLLTGPLGNVSGSVAATPAGLSGSQRLQID